MDGSTISGFDPQQAAASVRNLIGSNPLFRHATLARVPDLDVADMYAFSVMPQATGLAGEVIYLVGPSVILAAGNAHDFADLMRLLAVGSVAHALAAHAFARLFLRLRVMRRDVVLDRPDGHALLRPAQVPPEQFFPPEATFDSAGALYRFWSFDPSRMEPRRWEVRVAPDGQTSFS